MVRHRAGLNGDRRTAVVLAAPAVLLAGCWFAWPLATLFGRVLRPDALADAVRDDSLRRVVWFTVWQAAVSTIGALALGLPAAWVFGRYRFRGRRWAEAVAVVPFTLPTVVMATALREVFPDSWRDTTTAVLVAHVLVNVAVVLRLVSSAVARLDPALVDAARTLGVGPTPAMVRVVAPLVAPSVIAAASLVFTFCASSFGFVVLLGDPRQRTLEVELYRQVGQLARFDIAAALALVQLVGLLAVTATSQWWQRARTVTLPPPSPQWPRHPSGRTRIGVAAVATGAAAVVAVPMTALVLRSFSVGDRWGLTHWRNLWSGLDRPSVDPVAALARSATTAALVAVLVAVVAVTMALAVQRTGPRVRAVTELALMAPLATSALTLAVAYLVTFDEGWLDLRASRVLLVAAHVTVALPFAVRVVLPAADALGATPRQVAATLGAGPWRQVLSVELPLVRRPAAVAAGFAAAVSIGEFGSSALLTRVDNPTAPALIARLLGRPGELTSGLAAATAVALAIVIVVLAVFTTERTA